MKKLICLLLSVALLIPLTGCNHSTPNNPGNFYYRRIDTQYQSSDGVIAPEVRDLSGMRDDVQALLEAYFQGPSSGDLEAPFPRNTVLLEWNMVRNTLQIDLSKEFAQLTGIELTVACSCIAKTFLELTDATAVRIHSEDELLNGSTNITLTEQDILLSDDAVEKLRTDLTLYYTDEDRRYLIGHALSINLAAQDDIVAYLIQQLQNPPSGLGLVSPLPEDTKLLNSVIENGMCTLDFSSEFEVGAFSQTFAQRTTLLSLVNTLTQLEEINRVELKLDGNLMVRYRHLNITKALVYDESAIGPVRTGVNEFDATLYLHSGSSLYLAAVPTRIRNTTGISQAELVVNTLLSYENSNGFSTAIPKTTSLNQITIQDNVCIIDLSEAFLSAENLSLPVQVIIASVCALPDIDYAQIRIDGQIPDIAQRELFYKLSPGSDWFA